MKKGFILISFLMAACLALTGCSSESEPFEAKSYTPDVPVRGIELVVRDRAVEVTISEDQHVHIEYSENSKEYYDIAVSEDSILTVTGASDKDLSDYVGGKPSDEDRKISIQIPDSMLDSLAISTTNEDISLEALAVNGSISLSSNSDNISFDGLDAGKSISLDTKNGNIEGTIRGGWDDYAIRTEIKKGESNLPESKEGGSKTLDVSANNGNIDIKFEYKQGWKVM